MELKYTAPEYVCDAIKTLGRTEDVKFSPDNRQLAVTCFIKNRIAIFKLSIAASPHTRKITITDVAQITSTYLRRPHGVDFIDDDKIIVANRSGDATIFKLPSEAGGGNCYELVPIEVIPSGDVLKTPGNVSITRKSQDLYEALICDNFGAKVTRHLIDISETCSVKRNEILLQKWLDLPDGVSVNGQWIAVSNHNSHNILLYENTGSLNDRSDPDGILRCVHYPHGLRFSSDGRFILVADAGSPYVHIYQKDSSGWRGVRSPIKSVRVLPDEYYHRGVHDAGPKGLDIDNSMSTFVTTCQFQPLAFFDLAGILGEWIGQRDEENSPDCGQPLDPSYEKCCQAQRALEIRFELDSQAQSKQAIAFLKNSRSWRFTAPFRSISTFLKPPAPD